MTNNQKSIVVVSVLAGVITFAIFMRAKNSSVAAQYQDGYVPIAPYTPPASGAAAPVISTSPVNFDLSGLSPIARQTAPAYDPSITDILRATNPLDPGNSGCGCGTANPPVAAMLVSPTAAPIAQISQSADQPLTYPPIPSPISDLVFDPVRGTYVSPRSLLASPQLPQWH